ncbi:cadherin-12a isoform X1 [Tachysurus vachellii]|uniref:cadherin-12a isoform X1 n=1 Tax=Tachysurus vachellii TaxID=175792 RepID=UPI00296AA7FB|nr:cadherin-12a isoform X1 [Tachysurus vachellii]
MLMGNCVLLFLWCLLDKSFVSPMHRWGKEHHGALRDHRKPGMAAVQRVKRGWVWNQFFVLEEYMGSEPQYVGKLHSDLDRGDNLVKYTLSGEGVGSIFTIEPTTGDIHALRSLDREEKPYYMLKAQAVDVFTGNALEPESTFIIKVQDINDNEPKFLEGPYVASVPEMSPVGTYVTCVTATDADDPTYGNSAHIVYSVLYGQPYFSVEPKTGVIRIALPNMDREIKESYQVMIQAKDMGGQLGGLAGTTTVNITLTDVNDNPPRFAKSVFHLRVPESAPVGSSVGKIKAHDLDTGPNAEVEYRVVPGDGSSLFDIYTEGHTQEGIVLLKKPLDYESRKLYSFKVTASDPHMDAHFMQSGSHSDTAVVKLSVMDVEEAPIFSSSEYSMETREGAAGNAIGTVNAHDPDMGHSPIRYSIEWSADSENYFDVDPEEGTISSREALDRETTPKHNITVVATKVNNPQLFTRVIVTITVLDVNEFPPELSSPYEAFVCEDAKVGQVIQILSATDRDMPNLGHRFFFKSPRDIRNKNFTIRDYGNNTAGLLNRRAGLRRMEKSVYEVPVVVEDSGFPIQSSTGTLSIQVCACDVSGSVRSCSTKAFLLPLGLSPGALLAILLCVIILLAIVVLSVSLKRQRKKDALMLSREDARDNVIRYDDEGGGEEDTQAFDIGTLRHPEAIEDTPAQRYDLRDDEDGEDVHVYLQQRLQENHRDDTEPYDSLATFAYEGEGSMAESLSSIESQGHDSDINTDLTSIGDLGPRFNTLTLILTERKGAKDESRLSHAEGSEPRRDD